MHPISICITCLSLGNPLVIGMLTSAVTGKAAVLQTHRLNLALLFLTRLPQVFVESTGTPGTGGTDLATATAGTGTSEGTGQGMGALQGVVLASDVLGSTVTLGMPGQGTGPGLGLEYCHPRYGRHRHRPSYRNTGHGYRDRIGYSNGRHGYRYRSGHGNNSSGTRYKSGQLERHC